MNNSNNKPTFFDKYRAASNYTSKLNDLGPSEGKFGQMTFTNPYNQADKDRNMKALDEINKAQKDLGNILKKK